MKYIKLYLLLSLISLTISAAKAQNVLTLHEAIELACQNNASLQKRRIDLESMKELKKQLYTKYFPEITASSTGYMRNRGFAEGSDVLNYLIASFSASEGVEVTATDVQILKYGVFSEIKAVLPIYTGGRLTSANKLAKLGVEATAEMVALTENKLTQEVEKYFWQLVQLYEIDKMMVTLDSLVDKARQDASLALKAGLVTSNDKMEVDLYGSELESNHLKIDNGKKLCLEYLAYLVGVEDLDSVVSDDIYFVNEPARYFTDQTTALNNRHETRLLQLQKEASILKKKFDKGALLPTFGAMFSFNHHYLSAKGDAGIYHDYFDLHPFGWYVGAQLTVPISDWWGGKYKLRRADNAIRQAEIDYDDKQKLMKVEMSQKWNTLTEKYKQVDVARKRLEQAEQNRKQHASSYRSGASTMTDRLQADALYEKVRTNYIDACIKYRLAITEYKHATGRNGMDYIDGTQR